MGAFESRMWAVVSVAVSFLATAYFFSVIWALGGLLVLLLLVLRSLARSTIVWDLDQTLLVSQSQGDAAPELCETIQAIDGFVMRHAPVRIYGRLARLRLQLPHRPFGRRPAPHHQRGAVGDRASQSALSRQRLAALLAAAGRFGADRAGRRPDALLSGAAAQRLAYPAIQVRQHSLGRGAA